MKNYILIIKFKDGKESRVYPSVSPDAVRNKGYEYRKKYEGQIAGLYVWDIRRNCAYGKPISPVRTHECYYRGKDE